MTRHIERHDDSRETPGQIINRRFGAANVAQALELNRATVWRWAQPYPRGTGGTIPAPYHVPLLTLAQQSGIELSPNELVLGAPQQPGVTVMSNEGQQPEKPPKTLNKKRNGKK